MTSQAVTNNFARSDRKWRWRLLLVRAGVRLVRWEARGQSVTKVDGPWAVVSPTSKMQALAYFDNNKQLEQNGACLTQCA